MMLTNVEMGKAATVENLSKIDKKLRGRLLSLGFCQGCQFSVKQKAILNGPCTLEFKGQCISIRCQDAQLIEVKPL